jgi:hypothetical protein
MAGKKRRGGNNPFDGLGRTSPLSDLNRPTSITAARVNEIARNANKDLQDVITDEPLADLEDSELSEWERQQAIARERMRREGLI